MALFQLSQRNPIGYIHVDLLSCCGTREANYIPQGGPEPFMVAHASPTVPIYLSCLLGYIDSKIVVYSRRNQGKRSLDAMLRLATHGVTARTSDKENDGPRGTRIACIKVTAT